MRVRFTPEALQAARAKRAWWEQHRDKAPRLFVVELAAVVAKLRNGTDEARQRYALSGGRIIWRLLMPKTRNHVYYRLDPTPEWSRSSPSGMPRRAHRLTSNDANLRRGRGPAETQPGRDPTERM